MNFWRWLTTPDPHPGFTRSKLLRLALRLFLFVLVATLLSSLLSLRLRLLDTLVHLLVCRKEHLDLGNL